MAKQRFHLNEAAKIGERMASRNIATQDLLRDAHEAHGDLPISDRKQEYEFMKAPAKEKIKKIRCLGGQGRWAALR